MPKKEEKKRDESSEETSDSSDEQSSDVETKKKGGKKTKPKKKDKKTKKSGDKKKRKRHEVSSSESENSDDTGSSSDEEEEKAPPSKKSKKKGDTVDAPMPSVEKDDDSGEGTSSSKETSHQPNVEIIFLTEDSKYWPTKATPWSAAYDLFVKGNHVIDKRQISRIPTGLKINFKHNLNSCTLYTEMVPRSSTKYHGLNVQQGIIDADYTEEVFMTVSNESDDTMIIPDGSKLAQLLIYSAYDTQVKYKMKGKEFIEVSKKQNDEKIHKTESSGGSSDKSSVPLPYAVVKKDIFCFWQFDPKKKRMIVVSDVKYLMMFNFQKNEMEIAPMIPVDSYHQNQTFISPINKVTTNKEKVSEKEPEIIE